MIDCSHLRKEVTLPCANSVDGGRQHWTAAMPGVKPDGHWNTNRLLHDTKCARPWNWLPPPAVAMVTNWNEVQTIVFLLIHGLLPGLDDSQSGCAIVARQRLSRHRTRGDHTI